MADEDDRRYLNRELSWLDFNARVLALAEDPNTPLLERVKFLAIFSQNLDEFFQVRVAGLKERVAAGVRRRSVDGLSASEALEGWGVRNVFAGNVMDVQGTGFGVRVVPGNRVACDNQVEHAEDGYANVACR